MKRKTTQIGIPYYVKDNFLTEYQGSIERLENSVEEEYIVNMKQNCYRERNYRKYFYVKLIGFCKITSVGWSPFWLKVVMYQRFKIFED